VLTGGLAGQVGQGWQRKGERERNRVRFLIRNLKIEIELKQKGGFRKTF
jgi:hypothetical protein